MAIGLAKQDQDGQQGGGSPGDDDQGHRDAYNLFMAPADHKRGLLSA